MTKTIYNLKLHERTCIFDGGLFIEAMRVPGGWIYTFLDKSHNLLSSTYVPDHRDVILEESEQAQQETQE
jgi:hypothetical protein